MASIPTKDLMTDEEIKALDDFNELMDHTSVQHFANHAQELTELLKKVPRRVRN